MIATPYGAEQRALARSAVRRFTYGIAGSHDLGARVRYAAVEPELRRIAPPARVLDAGSGKGELCFAMARRWPHARIVGVEMEAELVDHAVRIKTAAMPEAHVRFERDTLPRRFDEPFDLVVSIDVLEHVDDDRGFVQSLADALAPGGSLILHTPSVNQWRFLGEFEEQHDHVRDGYEKAHLARLLDEAGLREVSVRSTFGTLGAIGWEGFALARRGNIAARAALPLWYVLSAIDTRRRPSYGLGLLATARRA
jgi:2-polyprenyl-3-methyl-5-hydroxy-6-metoxy-1,4-benzoquinol methylase